VLPGAENLPITRGGGMTVVAEPSPRHQPFGLPGVFVTPCAYLAHRRAESFPEPDVFRPERFLSGRFSPYAYFPFGGGVRRCIGMALALFEMQIVLGTLLRTFQFAPVESGPIRPVRRAVTIVASGGGRMYVERRAVRERLRASR